MVIKFISATSFQVNLKDLSDQKRIFILSSFFSVRFWAMRNSWRPPTLPAIPTRSVSGALSSLPTRAWTPPTPSSTPGAVAKRRNASAFVSLKVLRPRPPGRQRSRVCGLRRFRPRRSSPEARLKRNRRRRRLLLPLHRRRLRLRQSSPRGAA